MVIWRNLRVMNVVGEVATFFSQCVYVVMSGTMLQCTGKGLRAFYGDLRIISKGGILKREIRNFLISLKKYLNLENPNSSFSEITSKMLGF